MAAVISAMDTPMQWGQSDCCAAACTVFHTLHGVDPMENVRGRYKSAAEASNIVDPWGGLLPYAEHLAESCGLVAGIGETGEIGVSCGGRAIGFGGRCLLICVKPGVWAAKTRRGFATVREVDRSWRAQSHHF